MAHERVNDAANPVRSTNYPALIVEPSRFVLTRGIDHAIRFASMDLILAAIIPPSANEFSPGASVLRQNVISSVSQGIVIVRYVLARRKTLLLIFGNYQISFLELPG